MLFTEVKNSKRNVIPYDLFCCSYVYLIFLPISNLKITNDILLLLKILHPQLMQLISILTVLVWSNWLSSCDLRDLRKFRNCQSSVLSPHVFVKCERCTWKPLLLRLLHLRCEDALLVLTPISSCTVFLF